MKLPHRFVIGGAVGVGMMTLLVAAVVFVPVAMESMYLRDLASQDEARRRAAAESLGSLRSRRAVPMLIDLLPERQSDRHHDPTHYAHRALVRIGAPAIPALVDRLDGAIDEHDVAHVLVAIGLPAIPALVEKLRRGTRKTRNAAAGILGRIGEPSGHLVALLKEGDPEILEHALEALAMMGPGASSAAPEIAALAAHESQHVRLEAMNALEKIGTSGVIMASGIGGELCDPDPRIRARAVFALGKVAYPANSLPKLLQALDDPHHHVRCSAEWVLGRLGRAAREAVPRLVQILDRCTDHSEYVATVDALRSLEAGEEAVPAIARVLRGELLADMDSSVRESAAATLGSFGYNSGAAIGALSAALKDSVPRVRFRAVVALHLLRAVESVPALIELLAESRGDLQISSMIITAFSEMGSEAAQAALPLLKEIAKDEEAPARMEAESLLERWRQESQAPARRASLPRDADR
jgi:HEAT repeat protein